MTRFSRSLKFACLSAALILGACTHKQEAVQTQPPPVAPPPSQFALNQYNIEDSDKAVLGRQAAWLSKYPSVRVTIEGHADERGTREYNLALGARRANSVKEYLVSQGVSAGRVDTISYGKERPICTDSNEACWAQNRRGVTTITGGANS